MHAISFMLIDSRHALNPALDTPRFDDEMESFQPRVPCDERMDEWTFEATRCPTYFTLRDVLVN